MKDRKPGKVLYATDDELRDHNAYLREIADTSGICIWNEKSD